MNMSGGAVDRTINILSTAVCTGNPRIGNDLLHLGSSPRVDLEHASNDMSALLR